MYKIPHTEIPYFIPGWSGDAAKMQIARGLFNVQDKKPGRGRIRKYSWVETVALMNMHQLSFSGRGPKMNALVTEAIRGKIDSAKWIDPPKNTLDEIEHCIPQNEDEERGQEVIFFQFYPDKNADKLRRCEFIPRYRISWNELTTLGIWDEGAYYDYSSMIQGLAERVIEYYKNQGKLQLLKK